MNIPNTNIQLKDGQTIFMFCTDEQCCSERMMIISSGGAETLKKYKKLGFFVFGSPLFYHDWSFYALNKKLVQKTIRGQQVVISNAMYHINKHIERGGKVSIDMPEPEQKQNAHVHPVFANILNSF